MNRMNKVKPNPQLSKGKVLSNAVRVYARQLASDPKKGSAFLKRAGIITAAGKLSSNYR